MRILIGSEIVAGGDNIIAALPSAIGQSLMMLGQRGPAAEEEEEEPQAPSNRAPQTASDVSAMYGLRQSGPLFHGEDGGGLDWLLRQLRLAPPLGDKTVRSEPPSVAWDDGVSFEDEIVVEGFGYRPAWEYFANRPGTTYVPGSQRASPQPVERQIRGEFAEGRVRALGPSPPSHRDGFGEGLGMGTMSMLEPFYPEAYEYGHPATTPEQAQGRTDGMTAVAVLTLGLAAGGRSQPRVSRPSTAGAADDVARAGLIDEAARLAAADEALLGLGVRDAALRERMLAAGFDPAVMGAASAPTIRRFDQLFQGTVDRGRSFSGAWGTFETRIATITRAAELERLGYTVRFEVRFNGNGTFKRADIVMSRGDEARILQFETAPNSRGALYNQTWLQRYSNLPVEIVPVTRRRTSGG